MHNRFRWFLIFFLNTFRVEQTLTWSGKLFHNTLHLYFFILLFPKELLGTKMCKSLSYPGCTEYVRAWTWTEWPWERPGCCPCYVRIRAGRWFSDSASPQHASCTETSTRWSRPSNSQSRTRTGSPGSAIDPISSTEHENAPKDNAAEFKRQFCITNHEMCHFVTLCRRNYNSKYTTRNDMQ